MAIITSLAGLKHTNYVLLPNPLFSLCSSINNSNNNNINHPQYRSVIGHKSVEWNGISRFAKTFCTLISLTILVMIINLVIISRHHFFAATHQPSEQQQQFELAPLQRIGKLNCPIMSTAEFRQAVRIQKLGLFEVLSDDGQLDVNRTWTLIPQHFNRIWKKQLSKIEVLKLLADGDEYKFFIPFLAGDNHYYPPPCTIITLGVGHTVDAERNLINLYPQCRLITADPSAEINAKLTREIGGEFVHAAIGGNTAAGQPVNVRRESTFLWFWKVQIIERNWLPQIGIIDFLRTHVHDKQNSVIDLLLIDIEGAEFGIFDQFAYHYNRFPMPICQINIEVHDPDTLFANYTHQQFFRTFDVLLRSGQFALINTDMFTKQAPIHMFLRMFFVNILDEQCARKFLC